MEKLTDAQIGSLKYFFGKGELERFGNMITAIKPQIQEHHPELLKTWYDYKASIKIMDAVVKSL